jgi:hypothetical protein
MPNNDLSKYSTAQLEQMLKKMKQEKQATGSSLNKQEMSNVQKRINQGNGRFPSPLDKYRKKKK